MSEHRALAERFRSFHRGPPILVLPNAWDVASARVFAGLPGCRAVATTSAGIAESLGYTDHEGTPPDVMFEAVGRIASAVDVPVTADLEGGYGDPERAAEAALEAGCVGLNLEDGTHLPERPLVEIAVQEKRLAAVRSRADAFGVPLVVNARTDVFLAEVGAPGDRVDLVAERGRAYLGAGADCVLVAGVLDAPTIAAIVRAVGGPVSVLARGGAPPVRELEQLGVARVSVGPFPFRATLGLLERLGTQLLRDGSFEGLP
jgi:2-methylisocitrate lyase-like PEP mutase family enzyme